MGKNKTQATEVQVEDFLSTIENASQIEDSKILIELMEKLSNESATMWGPSIIGFGSYSYTYDSGHSGIAALVGFSPRKAAISLYVYTETDKNKDLLSRLGKFKMGKACIYVNKLSDIDLSVLSKMIEETIVYLERIHTRN